MRKVQFEVDRYHYPSGFYLGSSFSVESKNTSWNYVVIDFQFFRFEIVFSWWW